jgi:flagellar biosynthesis GTPase FlhF
MCSADDENEFIKEEAKTIAPQNLQRKRWIVMDIRSFKKAVMRLNTQNAEEIRDYYLNLEEFAFEYGQYVLERREAEQELKMMEAMAKLAIKDKSEEELKRQVEEEKKRAEEEKKRAEEEKKRAEEEKKRAEEEKKRAEEEKKRAEEEKKRAEEEKKRAEEEKKRAERAEHEKDQEKIAREKAERKALNIKKFMNRVSLKESKDEWIYIGTTRLYAQERLFKIGSTRRLTSRIPQYNTGRAATDHFYYAWAMKCYNAKDVDYHIQKLLADFKFKDPESPEADKAKDNRVEMYHGIKFSDLKDILTFIVNNYDESIECVNRFIRNRLDSSLEEEDEIPPPLDLKRVTCTIGEHEEVVEVEDEKELKVLFKNIMRCLKDQQAREELLVVERKILLNELSPFMSTTKTKTLLWGKVKSLISWKSSNVDLELSNSDDEAAGPSRPAAATSPFKYRVKY